MLRPESVSHAFDMAGGQCPRVRSAILLAVILTGCTGVDHSDMTGLDTGNIDPGATDALTFSEPGTYVFHCHPHPWMTLNVTVAEGGPAEALVEIRDTLEGGDATYLYAPADVTIGPSGVVTFRNAGNFTHTATQEAAGHMM